MLFLPFFFVLPCHPRLEQLLLVGSMSLVKCYVIIQLNINKIFGHFLSRKKILFLLCGLARRRDRAHQQTSSELHDLGLWAERRVYIFFFFFFIQGPTASSCC